MEQLLGAHTSIAGGVSKSVPLAENLGFTAMQIFTKNNNRWAAKPLEENKILKKIGRSGQLHMCISKNPISL